MEVLDYMEREGQRTLDELMRDYSASLDRVARLATLLIGGAAALVGLYFARADAGALPRYGTVWLLALAAVWSVVATVLVARAATSNELSNGASVFTLIADFEKNNGDFHAPGSTASRHALIEVRLEDLARRRGACEDYAKALNLRADALDAAYRLAAVAPIVAGFAAYVFR